MTINSKRLILLSMLILVVLCASGRADQQGGWPKPNSEMLVSTDWLQPRLRSRGIVILDIAGSPAEYQIAHIPGAVLLPIKELVTQCDNAPNELPRIAELELLFRRLGVGNRKRIILYSRDEILAARAWFTLDYLGHGSRAAVLDGGFAKWSQEKRPVTNVAVQTNPADFDVRPRPELVARTPAMLEVVDQFTLGLNPRLALVDSRAPDEFLGSRETVGVPRAGHIPGAVNVFWVDNFTPGAPRVLKSAEELRRLYDASFVTPDKTVITYCRTGMQAAVSYFVLRYLGFPVHLYDGSFTEWSTIKGIEIETGGR